MTAVPRPRHLTEAEAVTLTRAEILARVDAETKYIHGKRRKTEADHAKYHELMNIMYTHLAPGMVLQAMQDLKRRLEGAPSPEVDFWDSRPCDDKPEQST